MSTYAWVDLLSVLFPFLFSFHPRTPFRTEWRAAGIGVLAMIGLFGPWDAYFTAQGIWGFNPLHTWSARPLGLPIEEWGFFVCIPYACLFTYFCFERQVKADPFGKHARVISLVLCAFLLAVGVIFLDRAYTSSTCLLCAAFVLFVTLVVRPPWLGRFYLAWSVLLIPFLIVNGILTGTGLIEAVVLYNDNENLGLRILTIPVEDVFYGLLMQLMTVTFFEMARAHHTAASTA